MANTVLIGIILAAGSSSRFDSQNKICAPLNGLPLGLHAGRMMLDVALAEHVVITGVASAGLAWTGYRQILNERPDLGVAKSIKLGVTVAVEAEADGVILALADMPFITTDIFQSLVEKYDGASTRLVVSDGERRTPPALFGSAWFDALLRLDGDQGARDFIKEAAILTVGSEHLFDIDRISDLEEAAQGMRNLEKHRSSRTG